MKLTHDPDADAASIYFGTGSAETRTEPCDFEIVEGAVIGLFDGDDRLVGFEILGASRLLSAETLAQADRS